MRFIKEIAKKYQVVSQKQYKDIHDAAVYYDHLADLAPGSTKIWYAITTRDLGMGYEWCKKQGCLPDPKNLKKTHALIGSVKGTDKERLFHLLQGEMWSPQGEARDIIKKSGSSHTSMSVGDVIEVGGKAFMVDQSGFQELK